jgi:DNA-directed RNA polymerase subunit N (RpoN/RPB10)
MIRGITKPYGEKISDAEPVRCQKCGKPIGYVTLLARGLTSFQQPIQNVKIIAICMDCSQKKKELFRKMKTLDSV